MRPAEGTGERADSLRNRKLSQVSLLIGPSAVSLGDMSASGLGAAAGPASVAIVASARSAAQSVAAMDLMDRSDDDSELLSPRGDWLERRLGERTTSLLTSPALHDALAATACTVLAFSLENVDPRWAYMLKDPSILAWNSFPVKADTVPPWVVPLYSLLGPILLFVAYRLVSGRPTHEVARLGIVFVLSYALTGALTNCLKVPVGRPRPNFVQHCWPSGEVAWQGGGDRWGGYAQCEGGVPKELVSEIRKSFPSGHSALSASGLGFVTLFLLGQLRTFAHPASTTFQPTGPTASTTSPNAHAGTPVPTPGRRRRRLGRGWQLLIALLPSFGAVAVGVTRVMDYWHHPTDVLTGLLLGFSTAYGVYRTYYPSLSHPRCDVPLHVLEAAHARAAAGAAAADSRCREGGGGGDGEIGRMPYGIELGGAAAEAGRAGEGWTQQQHQQQLGPGVGDGARPLRQPLLAL